MDQPFHKSDFPQQVSSDQAGQDRSEIAFSSGASFVSFRTQENYINDFGPRHYRNTYELERSVFTPSTGTVVNSHRPTNPARYPDYRDYSQRLRSYARWTRTCPGPITLSEAGFFFTNQTDLVRCFQCGIGLKDFSEVDDPLLEHVRHSGDCLFLTEKLGQSELSALKARCRMQQQEQARQPQQTSRCRHPEYMTVEARISTFGGWPRDMIQTPRELAEAGLYYTGVEDQVRCFMCDGGLRRWDPEDVPWTEHCRWFPDCPYAREKKGDDFIALVQASAANNNEETVNFTSGQQSGNDMTGAMEQLTLRDPELRAALKDHIDTCLEMGYQLKHVNETIQELRNMGSIKPTIEEILDMIEVVKERQRSATELERKHNETPLEENLRLKKFIICMSCGKNNVNALFLPCTHHRLCMECAEPLTQCPVCERYIRQKIKTYLV